MRTLLVVMLLGFGCDATAKSTTPSPAKSLSSTNQLEPLDAANWEAAHARILEIKARKEAEFERESAEFRARIAGIMAKYSLHGNDEVIFKTGEIKRAPQTAATTPSGH